jgi:hypothetical protein
MRRRIMAAPISEWKFPPIDWDKDRLDYTTEGEFYDADSPEGAVQQVRRWVRRIQVMYRRHKFEEPPWTPEQNRPVYTDGLLLSPQLLQEVTYHDLVCDSDVDELRIGKNRKMRFGYVPAGWRKLVHPCEVVEQLGDTDY